MSGTHFRRRLDAPKRHVLIISTTTAAMSFLCVRLCVPLHTNYGRVIEFWIGYDCVAGGIWRQRSFATKLSCTIKYCRFCWVVAHVAKLMPYEIPLLSCEDYRFAFNCVGVCLCFLVCVCVCACGLYCRLQFVISSFVVKHD